MITIRLRKIDEKGMTNAQCYKKANIDRSGSMRGLEADTIGGMENASRIYSSAKMKGMIERQKEKYGWEFLFLGANIDAVEAAKHFGINEDRAVNYHCNSEGTALNYDVISDAICAVRGSAPLDAGWKKRIDEDYKCRKNKKRK